MNSPQPMPVPGPNNDLLAAVRAHQAGDLSGAEIRYRHILRTHPGSTIVRSLLSNLLLTGGNREALAEALEHAVFAARTDSYNAANHLLVGDIATKIQNWDCAADAYRRVIAIEPDLPDPYLRIKNPLVLTGRSGELVDLYDKAIRSYPKLPLERLTDFVALQDAAIERDIPGILLITMPKSGSLYLLARFARGLGIPICHASLDLFPVDHVVPAWAENLARGGAIAQEHLDASPENTNALKQAGFGKVVVHVRDPRQATLSWLHHVDTTVGDLLHLRQLISPPIPESYDELNFSQKIDWQIENHLPLLIDWSRQWMEFANSSGSGIEILFTRYEDFRTGETAFIHSIVEHFGISAEKFDFAPLNASGGSLHRRKGQSDEWRGRFSADQQRKAQKLVSEDLCTYFGWTP